LWVVELFFGPTGIVELFFQLSGTRLQVQGVITSILPNNGVGLNFFGGVKSGCHRGVSVTAQLAPHPDFMLWFIIAARGLEELFFHCLRKVPPAYAP
jgi:hypothetical protein